MNKKQIWLLLCFALALIPLFVPRHVFAQPRSDQTITTPQQLIDAVNSLRLARGLSALTVHPALMQSAQSQAAYMAATGNVTHERPGTTYTQQLLALGFPLAGDLSLGGFRSENILSTGNPMVWNGVPAAWQDEQHMNTMFSANYTHIGAGISQNGNGYYYALDCAAATGSEQMPSEASVILTSLPAGSNAAGASQYIVPMVISTALPNGDVYHQLQYGQTLWNVAIEYNTKIKDIQALNNLGGDLIVYQGQKLLVKRGATQPAPVIFPATETALVTLPPAAITPTPLIAASSTLVIASLTSMSASESSQSNTNSSRLLIGVLIIAAFVGGGVAVWLIRDPN